MSGCSLIHSYQFFDKTILVKRLSLVDVFLRRHNNNSCLEKITKCLLELNENLKVLLLYQ